MTCDRFKCRVGLLLMDRRSRWEIAQGSASSNRGSKRFKEGKLATRILRMTQKISPLAEMNYSRSQDWIPWDRSIVINFPRVWCLRKVSGDWTFCSGFLKVGGQMGTHWTRGDWGWRIWALRQLFIFRKLKDKDKSLDKAEIAIQYGKMH